MSQRNLAKGVACVESDSDSGLEDPFYVEVHLPLRKLDLQHTRRYGGHCDGNHKVIVAFDLIDSELDYDVEPLLTYEDMQ